MHFLIDADLPRSTADAVRDMGHEATDVRDVNLGRSPDEEIAEHARAHRYGILTGDFGFADIRHYPPEDYSGIAC